MGFKEHGLMLFLAPEGQIALAKLQVEKELGRSYAGLVAYYTGMYHLGMIDKPTYNKMIAKYSDGLVKPDPLTPEQISEQNEIEKQNKTFSMVLEQWSIHEDPKWRNDWIVKAEPWIDKCPPAKLIYDLRERVNG